MKKRAKVLLVGGPDVDGRIELMEALNGDFQLFAAGMESHLLAAFQQAAFAYDTYPMSRRVNPIADVVSLVMLFLLQRKIRVNAGNPPFIKKPRGS